MDGKSCRGRVGGVTANTIEDYVHRLRKLLKDRHTKVSIETVNGEGYLIREFSETAAPTKRGGKLINTMLGQITPGYIERRNQ
jgi:DNA-binding winged helix-turn-helix (wHTH) protein